MSHRQKLALRPPCAECPFLKKSLPGWLGADGPKDVWEKVHADDEFGYPCHVNMEHVASEEELGLGPRGWRKDPGSVEQCTGALLHATKTGKMYADPWREAARQAIKALVPIAGILGIEFMKHHEEKHGKKA